MALFGKVTRRSSELPALVYVSSRLKPAGTIIRINSVAFLQITVVLPTPGFPVNKNIRECRDLSGVQELLDTRIKSSTMDLPGVVVIKLIPIDENTNPG